MMKSKHNLDHMFPVFFETKMGQEIMEGIEEIRELDEAETNPPNPIDDLLPCPKCEMYFDYRRIYQAVLDVEINIPDTCPKCGKGLKAWNINYSPTRSDDD